MALRILFILPMMVGVERPLTDLHGTDLLKVLKTEKSLPVSARICTEYFYILKKAKEKYPSAQKVYDSDVKLKTGTIKIFPAETEKENN